MSNLIEIALLKRIERRLANIEAILTEQAPTKNQEDSPKLPSYPEYIRIGKDPGGVCLRYEHDNHYHRDAGNWTVYVKQVYDRFFIDMAFDPHLNHLHGEEVFPVSKEEWKESNKGYVYNSFLT